MSSNQDNSLPFSLRHQRMGGEAELGSDYRSRARRLRHRLRHNPARLHQSLVQLRDQENARQNRSRITVTTYVEDSSGAYLRTHADAALDDSFTGRPAPGAASRLAALVQRMLDGPVLRYSARQWVLREAHRLGLGRFEANLIIASVQHQYRAVPEAPPLEKPVSGALLKGITVALAIEAMALGALWLAWRFWA